jgi:hypothetical protein
MFLLQVNMPPPCHHSLFSPLETCTDRTFTKPSTFSTPAGQLSKSKLGGALEPRHAKIALGSRKATPHIVTFPHPPRPPTPGPPPRPGPLGPPRPPNPTPPPSPRRRTLRILHEDCLLNGSPRIALWGILAQLRVYFLRGRIASLHSVPGFLFTLAESLLILPAVLLRPRGIGYPGTHNTAALPPAASPQP